MAYGSKEVVAQMFELIDRGKIGDVDLGALLVRGDNIIDGYLRNFFTVPFSPAPGLIADASNNFATSFCIKQKFPGQQKTMMQHANSHYKEGWRIIKMIKKGSLSLGSDYPRTSVIDCTTDEDDVTFSKTTPH